MSKKTVGLPFSPNDVREGRPHGDAPFAVPDGWVKGEWLEIGRNDTHIVIERRLVPFEEDSAYGLNEVIRLTFLPQNMDWKLWLSWWFS